MIFGYRDERDGEKIIAKRKENLGLSKM